METSKDSDPKPKPCSQPWLKKNAKRLMILVLIVGIIVYVIVDTITKACTVTEGTRAHDYRIRCAGQPSIPFNCTTPDDQSWTQVGESCQKPSACIPFVLGSFLGWIEQTPGIGALVFACVYVFCTVAFVPGSLLTIGAGATYGAIFPLGIAVLVGSAAVWIGANIGAAIAFILGRYLFQEWVNGLSERFSILNAINLAISVQGFKTVLLLRLSPVIPFNVFNYLMGATEVKFKDYVSASLLGMLPGTVAYVFIGAAIGAAAGGGSSDECVTDNTVQYIVLGVGIVATIVAVAMISIQAKKEFQKAVNMVKNVEADEKELIVP